MEGRRQTITCAACGKRFTYWIREGVPHPKAKCYFCGKETFPNGEPPAAEAPAAEPSAAKPAAKTPAAGSAPA